MKISSSIQTKIEVDVNPPFFRKESNDYSKFVKYRALIDDNTFIQISRLKNEYVNITSGLVADNKPEILEAFAKWETVGETEFIEAYNSALEALSLAPKMVCSASHDDLKEINI